MKKEKMDTSEEAGGCFVGNGLGEKGLASARLTIKDNTLGLMNER